MLVATVNWLMHLSNAAFITGINLLIHTTLLIGFCLSIWSVLKRKERTAATQSVVLRVCLIAALLSPVTLSLFTFTGMNTFYLSTTLLNPPEFVNVISLKSTRSQSPTQSTKIPKPGETAPRANVQQKVLSTDTNNKVIPPVKNNEIIKAVPLKGVKVDKHLELTTPASVGKTGEDITGRKKTYLSQEKIIPVVAVVFTGLWCVFSLFLFVRFIAINLYIRRIRQLAADAKAEYRTTCHKAAEVLGIKPPAILQSSYVHSTMITGFFKPSIILPSGVNELPMASREVFLHELAHLARRDYLWNQLGQIGKIILPIQPLIWVLAHLIEEISDYVCDDYVVKFSTVNQSYARQLFNLALGSQPEYPVIQTGAGIISTGSPLRRRIERILDNTYARHVKINANEAMSITLLFVCSITFTGFIGVERHGPIPASKYVTRQVTDQIKTNAGNSFTVIRNPDPLLSSEHAESHMTATDSEREYEQTDVKKSANKEIRQAVNSLPGSNEGADIPAAETNTTTEDIQLVDENKSRDISESADTYTAAVIQQPHALENDDNVEFSALHEDTGHEPESRTDDGTIETAEIIPDEVVTETETGKLTATRSSDLQESDVADSHSDVQTDHFEMTHSLTASMLTGIDNQTPIPVPVQISYNYRDADRSNPGERRLSDLYQAADRNQKCPIWSPDGNHLAYSDPSYGIWMVPTSGGEPTLVYDNYQNIQWLKFNLKQAGLETLCFSPDGKEITFTLEVYDRIKGIDLDFLYDSLLNNRSFPEHIPVYIIASVNIETGEMQLVAEDTKSGAWSRDGRYFVYTKYSNPELRIIDSTTGEDRIIFHGKAVSPCFTAFNRHILFSRETTGGTIELFRIPLEGGNPEQLTFRDNDNPVDARIVTDCSPDGEWVLFNGIQAEKSFLGVFNTLSGSIHELFPDESSSHSSGKFSSDGTKICFFITEMDRFGPVENLYTSNFILPSEAPKKSTQGTAAKPETFALAGNFPNPFNASTTIRFSLHSAGYTRLTVYNMVGQKVSELIAGEMTEGTHSIVWNGKDDYGKKVSTGTYISQLQWGNLTTTGRMMLIK